MTTENTELYNQTRNTVAKALDLVAKGFVLMLWNDGRNWFYRLERYNKRGNPETVAKLECSMYNADSLIETLNAHHLNKPF